MIGQAEGTATGIRRTLLCASPVESLPGWETRLYLIEYPPGADGGGHHHPVIGLGYMLRGTILSAFGDEQPIAIREGQSFVDAAHQIHTVSRNASKTEPLRFVICLHRQAWRTSDGLTHVRRHRRRPAPGSRATGKSVSEIRRLHALSGKVGF